MYILQPGEFSHLISKGSEPTALEANDPTCCDMVKNTKPLSFTKKKISSQSDKTTNAKQQHEQQQRADYNCTPTE
jgi:hypothetical protein